MSRNDNSGHVSESLQFFRYAIERALENSPPRTAPARNPDPQMRLLEFTQPSYARFLRERQSNVNEEARRVDRANESEAFPSRRR